MPDIILTSLVACIPISGEWAIRDPGRCASKVALYTSGSVTDVAGDSKLNHFTFAPVTC